ncbi:DUF805 domain-containing protein [Clostridium sp.]|uniref:DUF805 domain-containing protein n=1 Tax=Clostridium sp. TaxID=1506 RepID=UPI002FCA3D26
MFNYFVESMRKYADFNGRARRKEYWYFNLVTILIAFVTVSLDYLLSLGGLVSVIYTLGILVPSISVTIRRLHDINLSGWWYLILLVPFGGIVMFIFSVMDTKPGANKFGPDPKAIDEIIL